MQSRVAPRDRSLPRLCTNASGSIVTDPSWSGFVSQRLDLVESRIHELLGVDPEPFGSEMARMGSAGGKRLRPAMLLLAYDAICSGKNGRAHDSAVVWERCRDIAAAFELLHTTTLVHDDVIDASPTRRWTRTIHSVSSPAQAILIGDYYIARCLGIVVSAGGAAVASQMEWAIRTICEGEVMQLQTLQSIGQTREQYLERIWRKTGALFSACCVSGGLLAGAKEAEQAALLQFGKQMGIAFQIQDDIADYVESSEATGKPSGHDIAEGSVTLPLLLALDDPASGSQLRDLLEPSFTQGATGSTGMGRRVDDAVVAEVVALVRASHGIVKSAALAEQYTSLAVEAAEELLAGGCAGADQLVALANTVGKGA